MTAASPRRGPARHVWATLLSHAVPSLAVALLAVAVTAIVILSIAGEAR